MWEDVANTSGSGNNHKKKSDLGFASQPEGWGVICELSPTRKDSLAPCPIPVLLHVQLVAQQEHGAVALAASRVQGEDLQVALAALEALPIVDAVDDEEGAGPAQVALTVPGAVLRARGAAELWSSHGPATLRRVFGTSGAPVPHLVGGVHHLQQHGLLVHQLLRGVGVLCKEKGGCEDGLGCPVFSKAKKSPACLECRGKSSSPSEEHPPPAPPSSLLPEATLFWGGWW